MKRISRVYIVRHGQVKGFEKFPVYGYTDAELTDIGLLQMQQMAERLRWLEAGAIYSSDLKRSIIGGRLIAQYHDVPHHSLAELREMYFGEWEGLIFSEIKKLFPEELDKRKADLLKYKAPGGGESIDSFSRRIMSCFDRILSEHKGNDIIIVGHGGINRIIICYALGLSPAQMFHIHQDYGCLNIIDYCKDSTLVRLING